MYDTMRWHFSRLQMSNDVQTTVVRCLSCTQNCRTDEKERKYVYLVQRTPLILSLSTYWVPCRKLTVETDTSSWERIATQCWRKLYRQQKRRLQGLPTFLWDIRWPTLEYCLQCLRTIDLSLRSGPLSHYAKNQRQDGDDYIVPPADQQTGRMIQCSYDFKNSALCGRTRKGLGHVCLLPNLRI